MRFREEGPDGDPRSSMRPVLCHHQSEGKTDQLWEILEADVGGEEEEKKQSKIRALTSDGFYSAGRASAFVGLHLTEYLITRLNYVIIMHFRHTEEDW